MPWRPMTREQAWLLPPTLDDLLPDDHPARFVAAFVDGLSEAEWMGLGVNMDGEALGAPAYHPRALLSVWLYGFMTGVRSSRKLESACRDQVPYRWLTGWQHPDHNTLWRFYQAYRTRMREPVPAQSAMFNAFESQAGMVERMAAFPLAGEGVAVYMMDLSLKSPSVPEWVQKPYRAIREDEAGRGGYPETVLANYATTDEVQANVRRAVAMSLALRKEYFDSLDRWVLEGKDW